MKTISLIGSGIFIFVIYLMFFNIVVDANWDLSQETEKTIKIGGTAEEVKTTDKISVEVQRPRFYGTIIERGNTKDLYFLWFFKIALERNGNNFIYIHSLVALMIAMILTSLKIINKKEDKNELEDFRIAYS